MRRYVQKRVLFLVPTLLLVSIITFSLLRIMPGDAAVARLMEAQSGGAGTEQQLARIRQDLGLDQPLPVQYLSWFAGVVQLDLGNSYYSRRPIVDELAPKLPVTLELALLATVFGVVFALPLGIVSALRQNGLTDYFARVLSIVGLSIPNFWLGVLVVLVLVSLFNWVPFEYVPIWMDPWNNLRHLAIPASVLGVAHAALLARLTRSSMLEVLRQDYVRTAHAKGLKARAVAIGHALPNALIPVVTMIGLRFSYLLGGAVIVEKIFVLPGVGLHLVSAVEFRDYPTVQSIILLMALAVVVVNLAIDVLYGVIDPRIRYG